MVAVRPVRTDQQDGGLRSEYLVSGAPVVPLPPGRFPPRLPLEGESIRLEPLDPAVHAADLWQASHADDRARVGVDPTRGRRCSPTKRRSPPGCVMMPPPPIWSPTRSRPGERPRFGMAAFMRIAPKDGALEIGHIWFAPFLQRTRGASEALMLMLRHAFDDLGYRRVEWKCDALNFSSRQAALRLGFRFEGIFFRHMIVKGRNRDTAWYAMLDEEWPERRAAYDAWLAASNFDEQGRQRCPLSRPAAAPASASAPG